MNLSLHSDRRAERREFSLLLHQHNPGDTSQQVFGQRQDPMADRRAAIGEMAERFGRTKGAVYSRLKKLDYFS